MESLTLIGFCKICGSPMFGKLRQQISPSDKEWEKYLLKTCQCVPVKWAEAE